MSTQATQPNLFIPEEGFSEEYDFAVTRAFFGTDASYNGGASLVLILEGCKVEDQSYKRVLFSIGKGWTEADNGARVYGPKEGSMFVKSSVIGRVMQRISSGELGQLAIDHFCTGLDPRHADSWNNVTWQMGMIMEETMDKNPDGSKIHKLKSVPVGFLGGVAAAAPVAAAPVAATRPAPPPPPAPPAPPASPAAQAQTVGNLDAATSATLRTLALASADAGSFTQVALPHISHLIGQDPTLMGSVINGTLYAQLRG